MHDFASPIRALFLSLTIAATAACGSSASSGEGGSGGGTPGFAVSGDQVSCVAAGADCAALSGMRTQIVDAYAAALAAEAYGRAEDIGACGQLVVDAQMATSDTCGLSVCGEICRLHPCSQLDQAACEEKCAAAGASFSEAQMKAIVHTAAGKPGLCSCDICAADTFSFCADVWGCNQG